MICTDHEILFGWSSQEECGGWGTWNICGRGERESAEIGLFTWGKHHWEEVGVDGKNKINEKSSDYSVDVNVLD